MQPTKISVIVTAYNHEPYIAQCLDGIIQQKGGFVLEAILGDDCSSDSTRRIMEDYRETYRDLFVLLPPTANVGIQKNIRRCLAASTGAYIAFCEGDDYWTDDYKLQKQLQFLQDHPHYSVCFHPVVMYLQSENKYVLNSAQLLLSKDTLSTEDLIDDNPICGFSSCMYSAAAVRGLPEGIFDIYTVDWMFNMACGRLGKIGCIRDWMSVYRIHGKGAWSGKSRAAQLRQQLTHIDTYNRFFSYEYDERFRKLRERLYGQIIAEKARLYGRVFIKIYGSMATLGRTVAITTIHLAGTTIAFVMRVRNRRANVKNATHT